MGGIHDDQPDAESKPLHILIAGAGIGGLTAAIALRQQGHHVEIFEQSKLSQETGAAIHLATNCNGLLRRLGFMAEDIGGVECTNVVEYLPHNGQVKYQVPVKKLGASLWAHPWYLVHRAHLHTALWEMAVNPDGKGPPAKLHLATRVQRIDAANGTIVLTDGTEFQGDLVIGADGVHSKTRASISGGDLKAFDSGKSAFRFMVPTQKLESDPKTAPLVKPGALSMWIGDDRRVIMYPCMNNTMMNFVLIHPSVESQADVGDEAGWQQTGSKDRMLAIYQSFHESVRAVIEKAEEDIKVWKLLDMDKMPTFVHERLGLLGDAAHPFLPHQGQGGGQAIEDAIALATLLPLGTSRQDIPERLSLYNECRYERSHKIQDFTRTAGKDAAELAAEGKKLDMMEYQKYNFGHDAYDFARGKLRALLNSKEKTLRFRSPLGFGASPGPRRPLGMSNIPLLQQANLETFQTLFVRFKSSRTYLENLLPPNFAFTRPGTLATASISCTTLDGMAWLARGGYSHCGLYIHGIYFTQHDGSKVYGSYLAVLFENSADPIITGRDELGMPKIYCDIDAGIVGNNASVSLAWRGTRFCQFNISGLATPEPTSSPPEPAPQTPPSPPPESGHFWHRYIPSVGEPGNADADYIVFNPHSDSSTQGDATSTTTLASKNASLAFDKGNWKTLPTLYHVATGLSEMPIYGIEEARFVKGVGVDDFSGARRIE
ncbi:uncharacterized protein MYCGRDRAFT_72701 [Zymoseptoria tritici IPO323]|uniref:FAD-binding domain-containing protein n=1 Tax=Zymoseptoria tritici (strain CBS 115943 / IPO323) TaxID=336722 RepID=F9XE20_ZYMTI|nr:uncharacterized protein MYCGRDRAFT_72701 [Zymoseptoria tritici IPO323]EGP86297.1 hypothetical protein MYCGRDRAFT_72701 [Zymoseptoria tritici IPO323]